MCGEFCTLPALFLKIIFSFNLIARKAHAPGSEGDGAHGDPPQRFDGLAQPPTRKKCSQRGTFRTCTSALGIGSDPAE